MLVIVLGRITQFILMLATLKISTYLLSPVEMGKMALITSCMAFFSLFLINPVGMYINRHLHDWNTKGVIREYLKYYWLYLFFIAVFSSVLLSVFNDIGIFKNDFSTLFLMFFVFSSLFFNTIHQTNIPSLNMLGFRHSFIVLSIATVFFGIIFSVILAHYFKPTSEYWLLGLLIAQVIFALVGTIMFYSKVNSEMIVIHSIFSLSEVKKILTFCWPIAIAVGLAWLQTQSYRLFLGYSIGLQNLGLFVAGYSISAGIFSAFESIVTTYFQPFFYKKISQADKQGRVLAWNHYAAVIIPSLILLFWVIVTLAASLSKLMLSEGYQNTVQYTVWGALVEMFRVWANIYGLAAHSEKNTKILMMPNLIGAAASVFFLTILIPFFGVLGVCVALSLAGLLVMIFLHNSLKDKYGIAIDYRDIVLAMSLGFIFWLLSYYFQMMVVENNLIIFMSQLLLLIFLIIPSQLYLLNKARDHYNQLI